MRFGSVRRVDDFDLRLWAVKQDASFVLALRF
jgi:hypothetical protein